MARDIKKIVKQMTLEEKAGLLSGLDFWHTKGVERLNVPSAMVSDGPHGLRKQEEGADHLGIHDSIRAVCFPAACATACSFDRALLGEMGGLLGEECMAEGVSVLLGPAVNIKRSPLCGRNFEYFSEDPYLAGELAAAFTLGVQEKGVGVSVKHFASNNQETRRMSVSAETEMRTLREIYLPAFEAVVKKAHPRTVMCAYNRINGVYCAENRELLTGILRDEWGFDGCVVSDWYAVGDRVAALAAGLDLEMPGGDLENDRRIVEAVRSGRIEEGVVDEAAERVLRFVYAYVDAKRPAVFDRERDHARAVDIACESAVLLKNDGVLPLKPEAGVLFVGEFAAVPRYQGGGSSHINAYRAEGAEAFAKKYGARYVKGFGADGEATEEEMAEALKVAEQARVTVVFAGLPDSYESEGYDRSHMRLPDAQNRLIAELAKRKRPLVVVLHNGSPVEMPWVNDVNAVLELYLAGEGAGEACVKLLYGEACPSGKLAETFPLRLADNPSYLNFPGDPKRVSYAEGVFVGYRYYDTKQQEVLFPFGHGLSYTRFAYRNLRLSAENFTEGETLTVSVDVENVGEVFGKEVAQLYVSDLTGAAVRPVRELKGFEKLALAPGEVKTAQFTLDSRAFSFYDAQVGCWRCGAGAFNIGVGASSRDVRLFANVVVTPRVLAPLNIDGNTTVEELFTRPETAKVMKVMKELVGAFRPESGSLGRTDSEMMRAAYLQAPLRTVRLALNLTREQYDGLLARLSAALGERQA